MLRARPSSSATLGLEYLILTAARTQEVLGAPWSEFDIDGRNWTVPVKRMKGRKEHRVPLSDRAIEILGIAAARRRGEHPFVFPGKNRGEPMSDMSFLMLLRRMARPDVTAHGFRSTFRDWCAEETDIAPEVAEMSLAHAISSKVERAYRRGDLFEKRKALMNAWAAFVTSEVV